MKAGDQVSFNINDLSHQLLPVNLSDIRISRRKLSVLRAETAEDRDFLFRLYENVAAFTEIYVWDTEFLVDDETRKSYYSLIPMPVGKWEMEVRGMFKTLVKEFFEDSHIHVKTVTAARGMGFIVEEGKRTEFYRRKKEVKKGETT